MYVWILLELYNSVGANNLSGGDIVFPVSAKGNSFPFRYSAFECDARKVTATVEGRITNARNAVGDSYACKATAKVERTVTNARNAVWDSYARNTGATGECVIAYARNAGNNYSHRSIRHETSTRNGKLIKGSSQG